VTVDVLPRLDPEFSILGVEPVAHAATPTMRFHAHVDDPTGREIVFQASSPSTTLSRS